MKFNFELSMHVCDYKTLLEENKKDEVNWGGK